MLSVEARLAARGADLRMRVETGSTTAVIGENGAGKSTLLALIAGLLRPDDGRIALDGRALTGAETWVPAHRRGVALLTQNPLLFPHLTVRDNAAFAPRARGAGRREARARADAWLEEVGVAHLADRPAGELSGGQAQRVALARALAAEPRLLLLDEPLSALDVGARSSMRGMLRRVLDGRSAVIVSHDPVDIAALADRVVVLGDGRVAQSGPTFDVLRRPATRFTAELMGLCLVAGRRDGEALVVDGVRLPATAEPDSPPDGAPATATIDPADVEVLAADDPRPGAEAVVTDLEHRGRTLRLRTTLLDADVALDRAADPALQPGARIRLAAAPTALVMGRDPGRAEDAAQP